MSSTRELRALWDTINSGGYKQAQSKISKELKKSPDNAYYLSLSAYVYLKQEKYTNAAELARKVGQSGPTNGHVLNLLVQIFLEMNLLEDCNVMFEIANRKAPSNVEIVDLWFETMVEIGNIKGLQKSSMAQQKVVTGDDQRSAALRAALHMYLAHPTASESEKKLFPMLALRMLEKVKPYKNVQEAYVHALSLKIQPNAADKLVEFLRSDEIKGFSGSLDLSMLLLDTLRDSKKYQELYDECSSHLKDISDENWIYWTNMNLAAKFLSKLDEVREFIKQFPSSRNSCLALIEVFSFQEDYSSMLDAMKEYFKLYGSKRCTIEDITRFVSVEGFDRDSWCEWLLSISDLPQKNRVAEATWKVNIERFRSMIRKDSVDDIVNRNIKSYQAYQDLLADKDSKDYHTAGDFLLVAATTILQNYSDNSNEKSTQYALEKAAILLELAGRNDYHQFYVKLWLIRVYLLMGAFTKAENHYNGLSIKMLQLETLSHSLCTRLSTIFPANSTLNDTKNIYDQSEDFSQYLKYGYNQGAYTQIEGFMDLDKKFKNSLNRKLLDIEKIRVSRLSPRAFKTTPSMEDDMSIDALEDNRDFTSMWNNNLDSEHKLSDIVTIGPIQTAHWAKANQLREKIISRVGDSGDNNVTELNGSMQELVESSNEFTTEEKWAIDVINVLVTHSKNRESKSSYEELEKKLDELTLQDKDEPVTWKWFHRAFVILETYQVVDNYLFRLKTNKNHIKSNLQAGEELRQRIEDKTKAIKTQAREMKDKRNKRYEQSIETLSPWAESLGINSSLVEDVLDSIGASHDKSLSKLRDPASF